MSTFTQEQKQNMMEESAPTMLEECAMPLLNLQKWLQDLPVPADQLVQKNLQLKQLAKIIDNLEHVEAPESDDESDDESDCNAHDSDSSSDDDDDSDSDGE